MDHAMDDIVGLINFTKETVREICVGMSSEHYEVLPHQLALMIVIISLFLLILFMVVTALGIVDVDPLFCLYDYDNPVYVEEQPKTIIRKIPNRNVRTKFKRSRGRAAVYNKKLRNS